MFKIYHTGITVKDLEESKKFYRDILGFKEVKSYEKPEAGLKCVFLELNRQIMELFESTKPKENNTLDDLHTIGIRHVAFAVPDIEEVYSKLKDIAIGIDKPAMGKSGSKYTFFSDPNGI